MDYPGLIHGVRAMASSAMFLENSIRASPQRDHALLLVCLTGLAAHAPGR